MDRSDKENSRQTDNLSSSFLREALQNSDNCIKALIDAIGDPLSIQDTAFTILYQNEMHKKFIGGDFAGKKCFAAYVNGTDVCPTCPIAFTFRDGAVHTIEKPGDPGKGIRNVEITASPLKDNEGNIIAGIEVIRDLTNRRKTEQELRAAEKQFRSLVEQSLVGIYIFQDDRLTYVNPRAVAVLGYSAEELYMKPLRELVIEKDLAPIQEHISRLVGNEIPFIHTTIACRKKDGSVIALEVQGTITEINGKPAIIGTFLDVTEDRRREAEKQKIRNMESLSTIASGIAHEYNNILTAIMGNLALAKMYAKPGYEVYDVLMEAEKASLRAKDLTSQLLSFAQGGILVKKLVFLQELLRDLISLTPNPRGIEHVLSAPANLWPVDVDEAQIAQAITTLLIRANHASPQGGTIRILADNVQMHDSSLFPLKEGRYVSVSITDGGEGTGEKELQTLFAPFSPGEVRLGGLELANIFSIMQKHGGHITAESAPAAGTTFRFFLPAIPERETAASVAYPSLKGKILVMDDEEIIRIVISRLLLQCGFETELAKDGSEMLRIYRAAKESGKPFAAVILDLIIQDGMGGHEAIHHLLTLDPYAKVIVSSGFSNDPIMADFRNHGFSGFLPKPYRLDELKRVLREVLASA